MTRKKMTTSEAARTAAKSKWKNNRQGTIESLKKGWQGRKERVRNQGVNDSAFTMAERKSFSRAKLMRSGNYALLYLREIGINPNRSDGLHKALRKLIVNEYKDAVSFYLQYLNVIDHTIKHSVEVDVWHLIKEVNRSRIANNKEPFPYSGELSRIAKGFGKRIKQ